MEEKQELTKQEKARANLAKARAAAKEKREAKLNAPASCQVKEKKHTATTPWTPASLLSIPDHLKEKGMRYRFCKADKSGNILKKQQEGWIVDQGLQRRVEEFYGAKPPTLDDGKSLDSSFAVREMLVMKMPEDRARSREAYFEKMSPNLKQMKRNLQREISEAAQEIGDGSYPGLVYGDIRETQDY